MQVSSARCGVTPGEAAPHGLAGGFERGDICQERGDPGFELDDLGF